MHTIPTDPVFPSVGPTRKAILLYRGTWRLFPAVAEACEYARLKGMIGALIRCVGSKEVCAEIVPAFPDYVFELASKYRTGTPPSLSYSVAFGSQMEA